MSLRESPLSERLRDATIAGVGSGLFTLLHQAVVGNSVTGALKSGSGEGVLCFFSSSLNLWLYNVLKQSGRNKTQLSENQVIGISIMLISVGSVGLSRYIMHLYMNSKSPENIAIIYAVGNMLAMYLYEILAIKNNIINRASARVRRTIAKFRNKP